MGIPRNAVAALGASAVLLLTAGPAQAENVRTITDHYLFDITLDEFTDVREQRPYPDRLDWSSDSCSWSPDRPLGYEFSTSCDRHDFGYRNYTRQQRLSEDNRRRIDDNFRADMYSACADDVLCESTADLYYWAVREFGGPDTSAREAVRRAREVTATAVSGWVDHAAEFVLTWRAD